MVLINAIWCPLDEIFTVELIKKGFYLLLRGWKITRSIKFSISPVEFALNAFQIMCDMFNIISITIEAKPIQDTIKEINLGNTKVLKWNNSVELIILQINACETLFCCCDIITIYTWYGVGVGFNIKCCILWSAKFQLICKF